MCKKLVIKGQKVVPLKVKVNPNVSFDFDLTSPYSCRLRARLHRCHAALQRSASCCSSARRRKPSRVCPENAPQPGTPTASLLTAAGPKIRRAGATAPQPAPRTPGGGSGTGGAALQRLYATGGPPSSDNRNTPETGE